MAELRVGIDIGGTFTDFVIFNPGSGVFKTFKLLSTPSNPAEVVIQGLNRIMRSNKHEDRLSWNVIHGSTVATNALLERKGARTALITTKGFKDVIQIGRQNRSELYDLAYDPVPQIVPDFLRFEVDERVDFQGNVQKILESEEVENCIRELELYAVESVAVSLIFSFLMPEHERMIAKKLLDAGYFISLSSEVLPEFREYERTSTTVINAYVTPVLDRYMINLQSDIDQIAPETSFRIMQSNGGAISIEEARRNGVRCIFSGPAGGVIGSKFIAEETEELSNDNRVREQDSGLRIITFDMGGTSTDVSLIDGNVRITTEATIGGFPIRIPVLDIQTIGAGGGSIAHVDAGGALRVGPGSAGAEPGPACYGKGDLPTVTDANLILGRLAVEFFLGGEMPLYFDRAKSGLHLLGQKLGLDIFHTALGIVEVVNSHMERLLRIISVEQGHDPRDFALLSFGGAGGLHATDLARRLGIPRVIIPSLASTLSAFGMLVADFIRDYTQTIMITGRFSNEVISGHLLRLEKQGEDDLIREGIPIQKIRFEKFVDMRYEGQSYELIVPFGDDLINCFHTLHRETYGFDKPDSPVEIVNVRVKAIGMVDPPRMKRSAHADQDPSSSLIDYRTVIFPDKAHAQGNLLRPAAVKTPFYYGDKLQAGNKIFGPAVIVYPDTTVLLSNGDTAMVDSLNNLSISVARYY